MLCDHLKKLLLDGLKKQFPYKLTIPYLGGGAFKKYISAKKLLITPYPIINMCAYFSVNSTVTVAQW
jgi:hypothetical protein